LSHRCDGRSFLRGTQHGSVLQVTAKETINYLWSPAKVSISHKVHYVAEKFSFFFNHEIAAN
jgi:hypothetical protein